jgi:hypothetical protein
MSLPIDVVAAGTALARVHRSANPPVFFGPGAGVPPTWRFDSPSRGFGVLYVGATLSGALVETLLRNPNRRMAAWRDVDSRASSELLCRRALRLARLHGAGLQRLGCDAAISTGPYEPCGAWADALWAHPETPDGIAYASRHDPRQICYAIFERPDLDFTVRSTTLLTDQLSDLAAILSEYGKSIARSPDQGRP